MKNILSYCIGLFIVIPSQSQNLVPNGDFEEYYSCPTMGAQLDSCMYWSNPSINFGGGSPDYFNRCSTFSYNVGIPVNNFGIQESHSGNAYCGLCNYYHSVFLDYREYIEVPFKTSLETNSCYHISFYINLANSSQLSSSNIGAYFSNTLISGINNYYPLPFIPQFNNTSTILPDTLNWLLVEGDIQAQGGEKFLIIGNFNNDATIATSFVNSSGWLEQVYLYIDDVSVYKCNTPVYAANAGSDKKICKGDSVALEMQYFSEYQYKWYTLGGVLLDTTNAITVTPDSTTQYMLWVRDFKYDQSYDTVTVVVDDNCMSLEIPNVFTPNGDGFNDNFYVKSDNLVSLSMVVYNRWGKKVFETNELSSGWDGKLNGKECAAGVYFYVVDVRFKNGKVQSKNGTVTLVR